MGNSLIATDSLLATLVHIQTHLDCDLSLDLLARQAGFSPSHFHRVFTSMVGETPKKYTQRLRLERAMIELCLYKTTVLETALACGFANHETFTRAFRRLFGRTPRDVRQSGFSGKPTGGEEIASTRSDYELSSTKVVTLKSMEVAFIRHVGPYEDVPDTLWAELTEWAKFRGLNGCPVLMGICQDAPGVTPAGKLRFDAAMQVPKSFSSEERVGHQTLAEGQFAVTRHVGPYASFPDAYRLIAQRLKELKDFRPTGVPTIELYHTTRINQNFGMNHTDVYFPVIPQRKQVHRGAK